MSSPAEELAPPPPSAAHRLRAQLRLALPFYLGLGAPGARRAGGGWRIRTAPGLPADLMGRLVSLYRAPAAAPGVVEAINFRCARVAPPGLGQCFFVKEFPRRHTLHDFERALSCSRVDRAWRAAHLLPRLGVLTPGPVGTAAARAPDGAITEYLATEWLEGVTPFPDVLAAADPDQRRLLLVEFAAHLRFWHNRGIYLRDLVKNILIRPEAGRRTWWLSDLDGLHPVRCITRRRLLRQMRQLVHWAGSLGAAEARAVRLAYLGSAPGPLGEAIERALRGES